MTTVQETLVEENPTMGGYWLDNRKVLSAAMIAPAILYIVAMIGFPLVLAVFYSLSDATTGSAELHFIGLKNFQAVLGDPIFRKALMNTFIFTLSSQIIVLILSNILAMVLSADFRGKWLVRFLILLPWTAPISLLFGLIFTFTDMTVVYVLTRGGPVHSTQVLNEPATLDHLRELLFHTLFYKYFNFRLS